MAEKTALVIGASMGGLLAARALSAHFDRVVVLDRDDLPDAPEVRSGVPQGRHIHILLLEGQQRLEKMFPGLSQELTDTGSPRMTWCKDSAYFTPGGWVKRFDSGIVTNMILRPDLEYRVRRRLAANPKITFLNGRDVRGLLTTADKTIVTGVETQVRGTGATEQHSADLIVDASGRGSKAPEWLTALGYDAPQETAVNSHVGYATRFYEKPDPAPDWVFLFANARSAEDNPRGAGIFDVGHGRWMVSLGGLNGEYPPTDEAGFEAFTRLLPTPTVAEALAHAKPISTIYGYRIDGSRQRHYEKLTRRPEHFILIADAVCAFNPVYGQGITVAAIEADELDTLLRQRGTADLRGFAAAFQRRIAQRLKTAWLLATGEDLRFPATEGDQPNALARLVQRYVNAYLRVSYDDEALTLAFIRVLNLNAPPTSLFAPSLVLRVVGKLLRRQGAGESAQQMRERVSIQG